MRRLAVVACIAVLLLVPAPAAACSGGQEALATGQVARVGETIIDEQQFQRRVAEFGSVISGQVPDKTNDPAGYQAFENKVLDYMVTLEIVRQRAASLKIKLTDQEVQAKLDEMTRASFGGDVAKLEQSLEAAGSDVGAYREELAEQMLILKARDAVIATAAGPTDGEIAAYYQDHPSEYSYEETRTVRHILIAPRPRAGGSVATEADWQEALARAGNVRAALTAGVDFAAEAKAESDDAATKDAGGELGTVSRRQTWPGFEEALWSLKLGDLSQPVRTQYGYELIQVTAITPGGERPLAEVKESIRQTLKAQKQEAAWQAWLAKSKRQLGVLTETGLGNRTPS